MKKPLFSFFFIFIYFSSFSQVAYYDATELRNLFSSPISPENYLRINETLANYLPDNSTDSTADLVRLEFSDNPFIGNLPIASNYFNFSSQNSSEKVGKSFSTIGGLNVTAFADGLAKFLVKRTKEELYVSFFSKLQDSTKYPEFKVLFPHTKLLVDNFQNWEYSNITNTLREAFDKDFKVLLESLPKLNNINIATCNKCDSTTIKRIQAMQKFFGSDNGLLFLSALGIANGFIKEQKVPDVFHNVSTSYLTKITSINTDQKNTIKLFDIISYSLKSNITGESYISLNTFNNIDSITRVIYYGLLYQQFKNEKITIKNVVVTDFFTPAKVSNVDKVKEFIKTMVGEGNTVAEAYKKLQDAKKKGEEDLSAYWAGIFESGQFFLDKATSNLIMIDPVFKIPEQVRNALAVSSKTLTVAHDIAVRNYSAVVIGTLALISDQLSTADNVSGFKAFFVKYASFAANVAQAKNSDDVEKAIEAVVLPIGSARIKRETIANISLNAFVGLHASHEFIKGVPDKLFINAYGITAPVGVAFAWGSRGKDNIIRKRKNGKEIGGKSNGIFLSLIDIGAITTLRFGDDKTEELPTIQLKDIISPGIFYSHGFGKCPISMNIGGQYGPLLRQITPSAATTGSAYWRVGFSVLVDIPLLNLYTKN